MALAANCKPVKQQGKRPLGRAQMIRPFAALFTIALMLSPVFALGDDWSAKQLRGGVLQFVDGQWEPLSIGMVVPDSRVVRTLATGHVTFVRGEETVELGPHTQIQIFDKAGRKPFTTVKQYSGTVSIEAQVENVQHFGVDTPYLAAVVKGTRFTVVSTKTGSSVTVRRGHVAVDDKGDKSRVTLSVGQSALVDVVKTHGALVVSGSGKLPAVQGGSGGTTSSSSSGGSTGSGGSSESGLVDLDVGGSGGIHVGVGGSNGLVNVGLGKSGQGGSDDSSGHESGRLLNLDIGRIHLGL